MENPHELTAHLIETLHPEQQWYFRAIKWLYDVTQRGTGRSHLIAVVVIDTAMNNPGVAISMVDHHPDGGRALSNVVLAILERAAQTFPWIPQRFRMVGAGHLIYDNTERVGTSGSQQIRQPEQQAPSDESRTSPYDRIRRNRTPADDGWGDVIRGADQASPLTRENFQRMYEAMQDTPTMNERQRQRLRQTYEEFRRRGMHADEIRQLAEAARRERELRAAEQLNRPMFYIDPGALSGGINMRPGAIYPAEDLTHEQRTGRSEVPPPSGAEGRQDQASSEAPEGETPF